MHEMLLSLPLAHFTIIQARSVPLDIKFFDFSAVFNLSTGLPSTFEGDALPHLMGHLTVSHLLARRRLVNRSSPPSSFHACVPIF